MDFIDFVVVRFAIGFLVGNMVAQMCWINPTYNHRLTTLEQRLEHKEAK